MLSHHGQNTTTTLHEMYVTFAILDISEVRGYSCTGWYRSTQHYCIYLNNKLIQFIWAFLSFSIYMCVQLFNRSTSKTAYN